jgi:hypothetical protein
MHPDNEWSYLERISIGGHVAMWAKVKAEFRDVPSPMEHGVVAHTSATAAILGEDQNDVHARTS